jgi:hypothetical protein
MKRVELNHKSNRHNFEYVQLARFTLNNQVFKEPIFGGQLRVLLHMVDQLAGAEIVDLVEGDSP